ncbi:collagen alpha-1(I) chain-like [Cavia porcellus]|uniref:collagen alpha-1(I) chain-like n=1 Tax=Cavia porcellus TaxID=10141 RepID=UPI002FE11DD7
METEDSAAPAPSPGRQSPQVAEGREGSHRCDAAASAGERRVPGTAPARGGGSGPGAARVPRGRRAARVRSGETGPCPSCSGDPANPGRSRITLKPASGPAGPQGPTCDHLSQQ